MSMLSGIKDAVVGRAMKLAGDPRVTRLVSDPRVMNAAMKAMSVGGSLKNGIEATGRLAATVLGFATREEVSGLRTTIQQLEDQVAVMEARAAKAAAPATAPGKKAAQPQS